jgi:hypothetical protein
VVGYKFLMPEHKIRVLKKIGLWVCKHEWSLNQIARLQCLSALYSFDETLSSHPYSFVASGRLVTN